MKTSNGIKMVLAGTGLAIALFAGCGERSGNKEYGKAMKAWKDGNLVQARSDFEKAIRIMSAKEPKSLAWNNLGLVLWQLGETEAAAEAFNESCVLSDTLTGANLNLGIALFHAGRLEEAEVALNNVSGDNPADQTAQTMLGLIAAQKRDWARALRTISKVVAANPGSPSAQNALALAELNSSQKTDQAIARLKNVVASYPDYAPAVYNLGVIHDQWLNNPSAAMGYYQDYLRKTGKQGKQADAASQAIARLDGTNAKTDPAAVVRFMTEGARLHGAQKYAEAVEQYKLAIQADPSQKNAHYNMGLAYYALKKYADAGQACVDALRIDSRFADARYMLSLSYFQQRKWADAEREAKELLKVDPKRGEEMLKHIEGARRQ